MNRAARHTKNGSPAVLRFEARLIAEPHAKAGSALILDLPKRVSNKFPSRGAISVEGAINGHPFRAALEPNGSGSRRVRVNNAMRKGAKATAGDKVKLAILGPEPDPVVPTDLRPILTAGGKALWKDLTPTGRRDWVRWFDGAKKPETRAKRIKLAGKWLSSGKRSPCCFNVYEYPSRCIYGDGYKYGASKLAR